MKRIIPIMILAVGLGGCAAELAKFQQVYTVATTATVDPSQAAIAVSSFEVLEAGATEYFKFCKGSPTSAACAPGTKASPGPLRLAIQYDRQGRAARDQIKTAGKTGQLISKTVYNLLIQAINNLPSIINATGVHS